MPSVTLQPHGDSVIWLEGRLSRGDGSPIRWTQGPYIPPLTAVQLLLPDGIDSRLSALRILAEARDPQTAAVRAVRQTEAFYVYVSGGKPSLLDESAARALVSLSSAPTGDGLVEDGLVGREVAP